MVSFDWLFKTISTTLLWALTFAVSHGLAVNVLRGLDTRVTIQLLLDGERRPSFIQPRSITVAECVPTDITADPGCDTCFANVLLLNFLLMVGPPGDRVGE